ncbi:MAG: Jag N-terminal domain-containing protein [Desulfobacteraceae bacterium]|nr:Jag N-terminal domain-containing protein [Desulfobacteraceae bacterium]MCF8094004.1 Jag N-terminal domain-containing protein [Desulfobacteraceae bacterium]
MREYRDFEEKNVEKAVERACSELGLEPEQLRYDIISHGSSGIFGLVGAKKAVIRVSLPEEPAQALQEEEKNAQHTSDDSGGDKSASALVDETFGPSAEVEEPLETASSSAQGAETRKAIADWVTGFLDRVISLISPESEISVKDEGEAIRFEIHGGDSARLIGKHGQTLDAVYYLVEKGVYKWFGSAVSIEIDVEGYLQKRRSELTSLASRLAEKALQTGKPMVINRINAQDRRVVHLSLKENREVRTQSIGNGDLRKLLIMPKKKGRPGRTKSGNQ